MRSLPEINDLLEKIDCQIDEASKAMEVAKSALNQREFEADLKKETLMFQAKCEGMADTKAKSYAFINGAEERAKAISADASYRTQARIFYQLIREKDSLVVQGNNIRKEMKY